MNTNEICEQFARKHKVIFEERGEVGFGRPCVGFVKGNGYIDYAPFDFRTMESISPPDDRLSPPESVPDAYHKHPCLAVLVHDDNYQAAIDQLAAWVQHLDTQGVVSVESYSTGATGIQALVSGVTGYAVRIDAPVRARTGE